MNPINNPPSVVKSNIPPAPPPPPQLLVGRSVKKLPPNPVFKSVQEELLYKLARAQAKGNYSNNVAESGIEHPSITGLLNPTFSDDLLAKAADPNSNLSPGLLRAIGLKVESEKLKGNDHFLEDAKARVAAKEQSVEKEKPNEEEKPTAPSRAKPFTEKSRDIGSVIEGLKKTYVQALTSKERERLKEKEEAEAQQRAIEEERQETKLKQQVADETTKKAYEAKKQ